MNPELNNIFYPVVIPILVGALILIIRSIPGALAIAASLITFAASAGLFLSGQTVASYPWLPFGADFSLRAYPFSSLSALFASLFTVLIILYSLKFMQDKTKGYKVKYYSYFLINLGFINGALFADNFIVLLFFWEAALIMLYALIHLGEQPESHNTANKAFLTVGFGDFCLMLGVLLFWHLTGGVNFSKVLTTSPMAIAAFMLMAAGAFAKAGAMPFHNWIPDAGLNAPVTVMAYLPASLDKLLGIYFLARISMEVFTFTPLMGISLMTIGSATIIAAVFMAMIQHDLKRLLSYHAISQVGYMVLGIGTGNPVGIAGGIFHMLNHTIYKSALFLGAGAVQKKAGATELDKLGGYAKTMPVTFISFLIAALAISGVPPLNGFFSKWMIYQGIIECGRSITLSWLFLIAAMFGSALTLASFMKLIHAVFLGQSVPSAEKSSEVNWTMWLPPLFLAALCVVFGIFALQIPMRLLIIPALGPNIKYYFDSGALFMGYWHPMAGAAFLILGLLIGLIIYLAGSAHARETQPYIGGEPMTEEMHVSGADFYQTIKDLPFFAVIYALAQKGAFDFYNWGVDITRSASEMIFISVDRLIDKAANGIMKLALSLGRFVRLLHGGFLSVYLLWSLLGLVVLLLVLMR